ncbi:MAG TPA: alpha/beta hydrolase [Xanthobacteraceae bacterium]|jgi:predicted dienelactone hydrolase|nr:alpha/beta hydrolase [Xanthobacteraceae bacterium]
MKNISLLLAALLTAVALPKTGYAQATNNGSLAVGFAARSLLPSGPYDWRGSPAHSASEVIWYPAEAGTAMKPQRIPPVGEALFEAAPAASNARIATAPAKLPLILLSHGTGGSAQSMAWFATALAAKGYIVAAINHPGNNALETYTVQGFMLWWLRAKDLSTMLSDLLADDEFGSRIDRNRIGAAGFSLGGYTMIEIAGGITSLAQFNKTCADAPQQSCKAPPEFGDLIGKTEALAKSDSDFAKALRGDSASYREPRVRAVFAMAPALGPAITEKSLKSISIPVAIAAGESDSVVPIDASAKYYVAKIPHAALTIFPGGVDHYVFLDECTDVGRKALPGLCVDKPGVDREAIHNATIDLAAKFFALHLSAR